MKEIDKAGNERNGFQEITEKVIRLLWYHRALQENYFFVWHIVLISSQTYQYPYEKEESFRVRENLD